MFGNKTYSYFTLQALDGMRKVVKELDDLSKFDEVCERIRDARNEWDLDSEPLSNRGFDELRDVFMQRLVDEYGDIEVFGDEVRADTLYERVYGEDHIKAAVLEQFVEQHLTLSKAQSWQTIMNAWGEVQKMVVDSLNCDGPNDDYYDPEEIKDALENVIDLLETYFGLD